MRQLAAIGLLTLVIAGPASSAASSAKAGSPPDIPEGVVFASGKLTPLKAGVTYRASSFPLALRVTPPTAGWGGAQYKANLFGPDEIKRRHLKCSTSPAICRPPYYGWVTIGQGPAIPAPRGLIIVLSSFSQTPSVAATVTSLRTRGTGAGYEPTAPVTIGGFSGIQFDGQLTGAKHVFVPFTPKTHHAGGFADAIEMDGAGHGFHIDVLNVRGKTVVVLIGTVVLPPDQFADFLTHAEQVVNSLRFPRQ